MTATIASLLDDAVGMLRRAPDVVLECAEVLPRPTTASLDALEVQRGISLPPWVVELYTQIGGAHISWRLSPEGHERLEPGCGDAPRYDITGNLDVLSPEELVDGFTGHPWAQIYERAPSFRPVDFASYGLNMGFRSGPGEDGGLSLLDLYGDRRVPLRATLLDYLRIGAELWFLGDWQHALLGDAESVRRASELRDVVRRLASG